MTGASVPGVKSVPRLTCAAASASLNSLRRAGRCLWWRHGRGARLIAKILVVAVTAKRIIVFNY